RDYRDGAGAVTGPMAVHREHAGRAGLTLDAQGLTMGSASTRAPMLPLLFGLGNLRANGHPSGGPWRQFHCTSCKGYFLETHGTIFHGKQATVELIVWVLACLAEGLGNRATARVFEVDPNTVLYWLGEAAEQLHTFSAFFLCDLHVEQLQLDELYA